MKPLYYIKNCIWEIKESCFSFACYAKIAEKKVIDSFLYFICMLFVVYIFLVGVIFYSLLFKFEPFLEGIADNIPKCMIKNGVLTTTKPVEISVEKGNYVFILNTKEKEINFNRYKRIYTAKKILMLTPKYIFVYGQGRSISKKWPDLGFNIKSFRIDKKVINKFKNALNYFLLPFAFVFFVAFVTFHSLNMLYFNIFGYFFVKLMELKVPMEHKTYWNKIMNLSIYAYTPALLFVVLMGAAIELFDLVFKYEYLQDIFLIIFASFFIGGYMSYRKYYFDRFETYA